MERTIRTRHAAPAADPCRAAETRLRRAAARLMAVVLSVSLVGCAGGATQDAGASACSAAEPIFNPTVEEMLGEERSHATTDEVMTYASARIDDVAPAHRLTVDQVAYVHAIFLADDEQAIEDVATRSIPELLSSPKYHAATSTVMGWLKEHCAFAESWTVTAEPISRSSGGFCEARAALMDGGAVKHPRDLDLKDEATRQVVQSLDDHAPAADRAVTSAYRFAAFAWAGLETSPSEAGEEPLREVLSRAPYSEAHEDVTATERC